MIQINFAFKLVWDLFSIFHFYWLLWIHNWPGMSKILRLSFPSHYNPFSWPFHWHLFHHLLIRIIEILAFLFFAFISYLSMYWSQPQIASLKACASLVNPPWFRFIFALTLLGILYAYWPNFEWKLQLLPIWSYLTWIYPWCSQFLYRNLSLQNCGILLRSHFG